MSSNWPLHSLSDFINVKHGFAFKGEFFKDERTADLLVTPGNFAIGGGFKSDKFKFYEGPVPEDYVLSEGDLIVTMTDLSKQADTLGYSALVPKVADCRLLHNQRVGLVEFKNDELDKTYLYFLLRSKEYRHHVVSTATGSTVKHSSPTKILSFEFRKPPKDIQIDIGKKLIALEEKIELNTQTNQTLEQIAQAIFKSWFVDFDPVKAKIEALAAGGNADDAELAAMRVISAKNVVELNSLKASNPEAFNKLAQTAALFPAAMQDSELGEIPEGWEVGKLANIIDFNPRRTLKKGTLAPYLDMKNVPTTGHLAIEVVDREMASGTKFVNGDTLLARITPCLENGKTAYVDFLKDNQVGWGSTEYIVMRPKEGYLTSIGYLLARDTNFRQQAIQSMTGTSGRQRADAKALAETAWLIYPKELVRAFDKTAKGYLSLAKINGDESKSLSEIRDALLPKLLSGELVGE
ncbi:TPA: restriction endonuclease subunit S [Vibrio cholerae]|nr:restriction endonuclease subunit S [Vibrio cholerae]HCJ7277772.1 restriction endonuclease subunit S [Vibrio cholerae]HCJ7315475.1 restriction endonuclease subunit S [Vibrio cholerae]